MKALLPVLRRLGDVEVVEGPSSALEFRAQSLSARGEHAHVICFCPPNLVPAGLQSPVTAVVAWEFESIPTATWSNNPANDWRKVLSSHGQVITLSSHTADVIRGSLGSDFPVTAVPVPMATRNQSKPLGGWGTSSSSGAIQINGAVLEYQNFDHFHDDLAALDRPSLPQWEGNELVLEFKAGSSQGAALIGFYDREEWGTWSSSRRPLMLLPFSVQGDVTLELHALAYGKNVGRVVEVSLGGAIQVLTLSHSGVYELRLFVAEAASVISVANLDVTGVEGAEDTRTMGLGLISLRLLRPGEADAPRISCSGVDARGPMRPHILLEFKKQSAMPVELHGFFDVEEWGVWSSSASPVVVLPFPLQGRVFMNLLATSYGNNIGRVVDIVAGEARHSIEITAECLSYEFTLDIRHPTRIISISELDTRPIPGATDPRPMGIGLISLDVGAGAKRGDEEAAEPRPPRGVSSTTQSFIPSGLVFTSVLNPADGRKNMADIVTAFCSALGQRRDATLVLKLTHHSLDACLAKLYRLLGRIGSIQARIVIAQGYLDDENYTRLVNETHWYVNASHGEGLCIPLLEFMSAGVPVIAPVHTAMRDFVTESSALIVGSSRMPTSWPNDPSGRLRTLHYRIDWQSLADCFEAAYGIAKAQPGRYVQMSDAAREAQRQFSSPDRVERLLRAHLLEDRQ